MVTIAQEGTPLRVARLRAGLSQERLAHAADCSLTTVRNIEHGRATSPAMLARLAAVLGVEPDALREGHGG